MFSSMGAARPEFENQSAQTCKGVVSFCKLCKKPIDLPRIVLYNLSSRAGTRRKTKNKKEWGVMEIILYGRKPGQPDYMEELLATWESAGADSDTKKTAAVVRAARRDGFVIFRRASFSFGAVPDFEKVFNL